MIVQWKASLIAVVVAETVALGLIASTTSMAATTRKHRHDDRQHEIIVRQQQQIAEYQRQLAARQQPAADNSNDFLSSIFCPRGYTTTLFTKECYPILPAPVYVVPAR